MLYDWQMPIDNELRELRSSPEFQKYLQKYPYATEQDIRENFPRIMELAYQLFNNEKAYCNK